jgi:uncharacterized membrane protein
LSVLPALTAFLASAVEAVEALTVVLAVGLTHGWRTALAGALWALAALAAIVLVFGPALLHFVPLPAVRFCVGVFLLLFGLSWLRKAVLRYGGRKALRDESSAFAREVAGLREVTERRTAFATSFQAVLLEGLEVAVIVVTVGGATAGGLASASAGALAAIAVVTLAAVAVRAPLARVPENALKLTVGVMLSAFGTYWSGEGLGIAWWHDDVAVVVLAALYLACAAALVALLRGSSKTAEVPA